MPVLRDIQFRQPSFDGIRKQEIPPGERAAVLCGDACSGIMESYIKPLTLADFGFRKRDAGRTAQYITDTGLLL